MAAATREGVLRRLHHVHTHTYTHSDPSEQRIARDELPPEVFVVVVFFSFAVFDSSFRIVAAHRVR